MTSARSSRLPSSMASSRSVLNRLPLSWIDTFLNRSRSSAIFSTAVLIVCSVRNTMTLASMVSCSSRRIAVTRSVPVESRSRSTCSTTSSAGFSGSSTKSAVCAYSAAAMPARLPNTLMSSRELVPRRFAPCTDTQATSPAAYRPGTTVVLSARTSPSTFVGMPPIT